MVGAPVKAKKKSVKKDAEAQVAILDAGAQYGKVIDRRVRNLRVKSEILPISTPIEELKKYSAIIISGGPEDVFATDAPMPDKKVFNIGKPILGICYGMQLMNYFFGGKVEKGNLREDGQFEAQIDTKSPIFKGLAKNQKVLLTHGNSVTVPASNFKIVARSNEIIAAISDDKKKIYGVQFHPEVDLTLKGKKILTNFLFGVAKLKPNYRLEDKLSQSIEYIRATVGDKSVLVFASGGVDSTVCAVLLAKALSPAQIHAVHIDTGFMRQGESLAVQKTLKKAGIKVRVVRAENKFLNASTIINGKRTKPLKNVSDPEIKRRIIGDTFVRIMESLVNNLKLSPTETILAQGTLRPDLIESASKLASEKAQVIKTHHNDTELVRNLRERGQVIEPLQQLHKDEVREIGEKLGLSNELVWRQPFPGPGLAVRLLCSDKQPDKNDLKKIEKMVGAFSDPDINATLLPIRTVGVQGDGRSYSYVVALSGKADWPKLMAKAREIPTKIHRVNRVVYVFGEKIDEKTLEITKTLPSKAAFQQLRQADAKVNQILRINDLLKSLSQVPVISFPIGFGQKNKRSIAIRTFITNDFMTGTPAMPGEDIAYKVLDKMVNQVLRVKGIARVAYDLTSKPPGTTEWE